MSDFKVAFNLTSTHEGGYVDDKDDYGKETYCGVSRKAHPNWSGWSIIDNIKKNHPRESWDGVMNCDIGLQEKVMQRFKATYWYPLHLDRCYDQDVANELYDTAVNQGTKRASKYLQRCLNIINRDQRDWPDIKVDGKVGNKTIQTLITCLIKGNRWKRALLKCLNGEQYMRYRIIAMFSSKQEKFMHGWLKRVRF